MTFKKPVVLFGIASTLLLSACVNPFPGFERSSLDDVNRRANMVGDAGDTMRRGGVIDSDRPFLGRNLNRANENQFVEDNGIAFPERFSRSDAIEIVTPEPLPIEGVRTLLEELTEFGVVVRTRYEAGDEDLQIPINGRMRLNHRGSLESLVRTIATNFDLAWNFDGRTIVFDRMETRSYDLPLPSTSGVVNTSLSGVNIAGNSVSATKNITMDPWAEITEALESLVEAPGRINVSRNTGRVSVFAPPSAQREAAKVIKGFYDLYSNRIGIEIATFYVDASKTSDLNIDFGASLNSGSFSGELGQGLEQALQGGIGVISGSAGYAAVNLRNIARSSAVSDYQMSNTIAQNGVVAPVVLTNSRGYVSRITAATADSGASVETDNINSGISIYALPRLMRNGKIQMSIWVTQSELNRLETFDTGSGFVQLPDADQRAVEYTLIMEPGETLIMGGYEQERARSSQGGGIGALGALGIGRNQSGQTERTRMILMVRPTIIGG